MTSVDKNTDDLNVEQSSECLESISSRTNPEDSLAPIILSEEELLASTIQNKALQMKANIQETLQELGKSTDCETIKDSSAHDKLIDFEKTINKSINNTTTDGITNENTKNTITDIGENFEDTSLQLNSDICETSLNQLKPLEINHSPNKGKSATEQLSRSTRGQSPASPAVPGKRKSEKTVDQVLKWLSGCGGSSEEKLQMLCRKHVETLEEARSFEYKWRQSDRQSNLLYREKEQLQAEHSRVLLIRSRLEGLCRELQRQNRAVKDESLLRLREEEEKRKEISTKFQGTLNDITSLTQENQQRNSKLKEENDELAQKLKGLIEHYEAWEKHNEKVNHQKELECQLAKAKLAKSQLQLRQAQEENLSERQRLIGTLEALQERCTLLASNEVQVRNELALYTSKYEEFQTVLTNSNQVFGSFKSDMEKMSKKIKTLEKETNQWKLKWESSNVALIEMAADKQKRDQDLLSSHQRVNTLEKLCRALQAERNSLQNKLKTAIPEDNIKVEDENKTNLLEKNEDFQAPKETIIESSVLLNNEEKVEIASG